MVEIERNSEELVDPGPPPEVETHQMRILVKSLETAKAIWPKATHYGDLTLSWNPLDPDDVKVQEEAFNRAIKMGFRAYLMDEKDRAGAPVTKFDPQATRLLLIPQIVGG